jgi:hypothetical protein
MANTRTTTLPVVRGGALYWRIATSSRSGHAGDVRHYQPELEPIVCLCAITAVTVAPTTIGSAGPIGATVCSPSASAGTTFRKPAGRSRSTPSSGVCCERNGDVKDTVSRRRELRARSHPTLRSRVDSVVLRKDQQGGQGTSPCPPCLITWSLGRFVEEPKPSCDDRAQGVASKYGNERGLDSVRSLNIGEIASAARRLTGTVRGCSRAFRTSTVPSPASNGERSGAALPDGLPPPLHLHHVLLHSSP